MYVFDALPYTYNLYMYITMYLLDEHSIIYKLIK